MPNRHRQCQVHLRVCTSCVHPPSVSDILKGKGKKRAITIITSDEDSDGKNSEDGESDSPSKKVEKGVYQFRSPDN